VLVWIGGARVPAFLGKAEITSDTAVQKKILDDFRNKYWQNRLFGVGPSRSEFDNGNRVAIVHYAEYAICRGGRDARNGSGGAPARRAQLDARAVGKCWFLHSAVE